MTTGEDLRYDVSDQIAEISLARPPVAGNAAPMPDGPFCADNAYARLHAEAVDASSDAAHLALSNDAINCSLHEGRYGHVLRLPMSFFDRAIR